MRSTIERINQLWGLGWDREQLSEVAAELGSDIPFFLAKRGAGAGMAGGFRMTPRWPHDTTNMGVYYVRGPW